MALAGARTMTNGLALARTWSRDWGGLLVLARVAHSLAFSLFALFHWGGESQSFLGDLLFAPVGLISAMLAWRASRHLALDPRTRRAWKLIALGQIAIWLGDILWFYLEGVLDVQPYPSLADVCYLSLYPLTFLGLLCFPGRQQSREERLKFLLDALIVMLGSGMVVWYLVLRPTALQSQSDLLTTITSVAYPVGDLVLLLGLARVSLRVVLPSSRRALQLVAAGMLLYVAADVAYGYLGLQNLYEGGGPVDIGWMVGGLFIATGAQYQYWYASRLRESADQPDGRPASSLLPYLSVAVGYGLLLSASRDMAGEALQQLIVGAVALTGGVVARQFTALRENARLLQRMAALQDELTYRAFHDPVTALPNRALFREHLAAALARAGQQQEILALLFLDLDNFKEVNDTLGHEAGDEVLRIAAERLRRCVKIGDTVARFGGDEFAILLSGVADREDAAQVAERIAAAIRAPIVFQDRHWLLDVSIGITSSRGETADELVRQADVAMYAAKNAGKGRIAVYRPGLGTAPGSRAELVASLRPSGALP